MVLIEYYSAVRILLPVQPTCIPSNKVYGFIFNPIMLFPPVVAY